MFRTLFFVVLIVLLLNGVCGNLNVHWPHFDPGMGLDRIFGGGFGGLLGDVIALIVSAAVIALTLMIAGFIGLLVLGVVLLGALFGGGFALFGLLPLVFPILIVLAIIALLRPARG